MNTGHTDHDDLYMCYKASCYDASTTERYIHNVLQRCRLSKTREFFKIDFDTARTIVDIACQERTESYDKIIRVLEQARLLPLPTINAHYHEMYTPPSKKETSKTNSITKYFKKEEREEQRK